MSTLTYSGDVNTTKTGLQCQRWDAQTPHMYNITMDMLPELDLPSARNYCRDPDAFIVCLWCYTMDPDVRWQCCNVWRCFPATSRSQFYMLMFFGLAPFSVSFLCQFLFGPYYHGAFKLDPVFSVCNIVFK